MKKMTISTEITLVSTILKFTFGLVPIVAGADKFLNLLVQWDLYLNPVVAGLLPFSVGVFMSIIGTIEIIAGLIVLIRPGTGGYIVAAWLLLIALSLIASGHFLDVAVRDLVMAIGAFVLARLTTIRDNL
jgi:hypothetical protein